MIPIIRHYVKGKTEETIKRSEVARGEGWGMKRQTTEDL